MAEVTRLVGSAIATAVAEGEEGEGLADAMATLDMNESTREDDQLTCRWCQKQSKSLAAINVHIQKWCKMRPDAEEMRPDAEEGHEGHEDDDEEEQEPQQHEARFDDETLDDETLNTLEAQFDDEALNDETLNMLEAQFDQHLERAVAQGRLSEAEADAMTDQIASKPNNAARCEAMRRIMKGEIGEIGLKGGQVGGENEPNRSEGDARDDGARHDAPELTLLQFMEEIDRERAEHASRAPGTAPNWFGLERRRPPPPPPPPPQQQQQAVLAKGPSPFARLLRLEPSERGKVVERLSSLPTWGGNIEGLTLVAGRWEPSSFSGETLDVALFNAEVQSKTLVD